MASEDRHESILECIREVLASGTNDEYMSDEIRIEDFAPNQEPEYGITISPAGERELHGTNERDDIEYITVVTRVAHSLGDDDRRAKSLFRVNLRKLLHNKRLACVDCCTAISRVEFGEFAIPRKWTSENKSVSSMRVFVLVRESR